MGILKWYKRDPRAALAGMASLNLAERGAYNTVLDLIYINDGKLPDNGKEIAHWLRIDVRRWLRIRKRLIEKGKLYPYAGELHNERADIEVQETLKRIAQAAEAGRKRWAAYNEIKDLADATAKRPQCYLQPQTKSLSARIVPIHKEDNRDKKK